MTYHRDKANPVLSYLVGIAAIVLVLVLVFLTPLPRALGRMAHGIGRIFFNAKEVAAERVEENSRFILMTKNALVDLATDQEKELATAQAVAWDVQNLRQENAELRSLLGYVEAHSQARAVKIISRPPQSVYDRVIIDQGSEDGIVVGMRATAYGTVAMGVVEETYPRTSFVRLYSTSAVESQVRFVGMDLSAAAIGHGGGTYIVELPQSIEMSVGTQVVEVATGTLLGVVGKVASDPREPFQKVYVRTPVNIKSLEWLYLE